MRAIYDDIGADNLKILVDKFYDLVFENEEIKDLFKTEKSEIKRKQYLFLTQFLGGPDLYSQEFGHPRLRARHLPHPISNDKAVAWLKCMHEAIESLDLSRELKDELFSRFPQTAFFMVNQQD
ncbi:MAG: globin [Cytophagaceae bacterium]